MSSIYEITGDLLKLYELMDDPEMDEDAILDSMEGVFGELELKADSYGKLITNVNSDINDLEAVKASLQKEIDRLDARINTKKHFIATLKDRIMFCMDTAKIPEIAGSLFKFKPQNSGKQLPKDIDSHASDIPEQYWIPQPPKMDKKLLLDDLKTGKIKIDGVELRTPRSLRMR